jgi:hypothetical protein
VGRVLEALRDNGYSLRDFEATILIPFVLEKSGQVRTARRHLSSNVQDACVVSNVVRDEPRGHRAL